MTGAQLVSSAKIIDPHTAALANVALHAGRISGEFGVIVRFVQPNQPPACMKVTGHHSPGYFKARIPCHELETVIRDRNVVSVELREHVMQ